MTVPSSWSCASILELCEMVKGTTAISRAQPGPYPLVTTGEERKSADHYQFDTEAVCIPMISSTGHGHASLKRVQHQSGKFALANLLTALIVRDTTLLMPRFLHLYMTFFKDVLIVPLMAGAANMALTIDKLAAVKVAFPTLEEQIRILKIVDEVDEILRMRNQANQRTADLMPAYFLEAFGDPSTNRRGWPTKAVKDIATVITGNTPSTRISEYYGNEIEWIKSDNIDTSSHFLTPAEMGLSPLGRKVGRIAPAHATLVTCIAGSLTSIGNAALADREVAFNQQINAAIPKAGTDPYFLYVMIRLLRRAIQARATEGMKRIINKSKFENIPVIAPDPQLQMEFGKEIASICAVSRDQEQSSKRLSDLKRSVLHRVFQGEHFSSAYNH